MGLLPDSDPLLAIEAEDSGFVKALRFHLGGATLNAIAQVGFDRSITFDFTRKDIYGRETERTLRVELVGRASTAYLLSEKGMVISMFKPVPAGRNSVRRVVTGKPLPPPPPLGKYLATEGEQALETALVTAETRAPDNPIRELLTRQVAGSDVHLWGGLGPMISQAMSVDSLHELIATLQCGELTQTLFDLRERSANDATLELWTAARGSDSRKPGAITDPPRNNRALQIEQQLSVAKRAEELEAAGIEMLQRAASLSNRESESAYLKGWQIAHPDWSDRVDLAKTAEENAGTLIEYAQRLKRARPKLQEMLADPVGARPGPARGAASEDGAGRAPAPTQDSLARDIAKLERNGVKYLRYVTSDGMQLLVGQSDRSNDELVRHYSSSRHLWLHVRDYPGSHVLLLTNGRDVPHRSLEEAAVVAGYYSQGRGEIDLDVSYTPIKQLRRPKGGKPGQVLKLSEKVIRVNPMRFEAIRDVLRIQSSA